MDVWCGLDLGMYTDFAAVSVLNRFLAIDRATGRPDASKGQKCTFGRSAGAALASEDGLFGDHAGRRPDRASAGSPPSLPLVWMLRRRQVPWSRSARRWPMTRSKSGGSA